YEPMILPGESISKYRGRPGQTATASNAAAAPTSTPVLESAGTGAVAGSFPEDEPLFATGLTEPLHEQHGDFDHPDEAAHQEWEREHAIQDRMNLTAAFSHESAAEPEDTIEEITHATPPEMESRMDSKPAPEPSGTVEAVAAYAS